MYTELKQVKYTQQLQRQRINEDDWQYLKSHYAWIWQDYKKMFIKKSLRALLLGSMNLQELKYGYRMDISMGGFPSHLHICSLVYNKSWPNYHSCHLHVLSIYMRGLYFASSPVKGFAAPGHTHTALVEGGFLIFFKHRRKNYFFTSGLKNIHFVIFVWKSVYLLLWAFCTLIVFVSVKLV